VRIERTIERIEAGFGDELADPPLDGPVLKALDVMRWSCS
jgi:hypothetical protein